MAKLDHLYDAYDLSKYGPKGAAILEYLRREIEANHHVAEYNIHNMIWAALDAEFYNILAEEGSSKELLFDLIAQSAILAVCFTHADGTQNLVYTLLDATPARQAVPA